MTARPLKGLAAIGDAAVAAAPAIHVLILDGIPRTGLTVREVAAITGLKYRQVLDAIRDRRIRVITGGRNHIIPVSELAEIETWATYLDTTA